ncbi:MAG: hypothetical protein IJ371_02320 [Clostridia bacterium]|nr:hypothetical protein [Clostridia bacterium]
MNKEIKRTERLIRTRINENLLKVNEQSCQVKSMLKLGLQTSNPVQHEVPTSIYDVLSNLDSMSYYTSRDNLLRTAIILGTSRNTIAQENIMNVIRERLGKIKDKDYLFIANLISLKDPVIVDKVNAYLCQNLEGFSELHKKYYNKYYIV